MTNLLNIKEAKIAVIGLGYVGLPLAIEVARSGSVVGPWVTKAGVAVANVCQLQFEVWQEFRVDGQFQNDLVTQ